jgi:dihydropteroate synthase
VDLSQPKVMGIINITDDSFYDGGKCINEKDIYLQAEKYLEEGADIIDIGGYSSRPYAKDIPLHIEIERVLKGLAVVKKLDHKVPVSIDTFRSEVARKAVEKGANMINDISGGNLDDKMFATIAELNVPYIVMHMVGSPQNMAHNTSYGNLKLNILDYFSKKTRLLTQLGVKDVIIDIGFGFSKNITQNYDLLANLKYFQMLNLPILVGISRKSMIYKILETNSEQALNGTSVINAISLLKSAKILRVHDVKAAKEVTKLINLIPH